MKKRQRICAFMAVCAMMLCISPRALALPYESYTYDAYANIVSIPAPYAPREGITGVRLGVGAFSQPADVAVGEDGVFYLADTGNDRVVIFSQDLTLLDVIGAYQMNGQEVKLNKPQGVYALDGMVYVCDTGNGRVVTLQKDHEQWMARGVIERPQSALLAADFVFAPLKVAVDEAKRVYVIGRNVLEGLMVFDGGGAFMGYFGTIKVQVSVADWIWRQFATQEQRKKMSLFIPTEFTGLDIDDEGFIFTTEINSQADQTIKRVNPAGIDVVRNYSGLDLIGDLWYANVGGVTGPSEFLDITVRGGGGYSAIDGKRGRIFTYDEEGNLLYVFGGLGTEYGMLNKPSAIAVYGETLYVLDQGRGMLMRYEPTAFGQAVNAATRAWHDGEDALAEEFWAKVLKYCGHYELAYAGLGKAYLSAGDSEKAVEYLERGMDKRYYSVALRRHRSDVVKAYFVPVSCGLIGVCAAAFAVRAVLKRRKRHA